jgi:uncharacterized protein (DUF2267 family)
MGSRVDELFGQTIEKTMLWLDQLGEDLTWDHPAGLLAALRAGLHALRDRLTVGEAAQLGAQLPLLVRGLYFEGWRPAAEPWKERHGAGFLERIEKELGGYADLRDPESVARAVFQLLRRHVSPGEIEQVVATLPAEVRQLW